MSVHRSPSAILGPLSKGDKQDGEAAAHERRTEERARVLALPHGFQAIPQLVPRAG